MAGTSAIRAARRRSGLTQEQLAAAVGVDQSTLSRIENGQMPPADVAYRLTRILGLSLEEIVGEPLAAATGTEG